MKTERLILLVANVIGAVALFHISPYVSGMNTIMSVWLLRELIYER